MFWKSHFPGRVLQMFTVNDYKKFALTWSPYMCTRQVTARQCWAKKADFSKTFNLLLDIKLYYYGYQKLLYLTIIPDNLIPTLINFPKRFYTQVIVQAPLAVDSFFLLRWIFRTLFIWLSGCFQHPSRMHFECVQQANVHYLTAVYISSGLLASYIFFKKLTKDKSIKNPRNPLMWLMIYVKRYTRWLMPPCYFPRIAFIFHFRITPTYAVIMLFDVTLFAYVSSGPFWRPIEKQGCRFSWWTNFLYMNNFLLQDIEAVGVKKVHSIEIRK